MDLPHRQQRALSEFKAKEGHGWIDCLEKSEWLAKQRMNSGRAGEKTHLDFWMETRGHRGVSSAAVTNYPLGG